MTGDTANDAGVLSEEIKALLILLLLKGGTPSDEIETALRLAGSRPAHSELPAQEAMCPLAARRCWRWRRRCRLRSRRPGRLHCSRCCRRSRFSETIN